ncbi:hypothetical protein ACIGDM_00995 [Rothia koreensis]|uniref:hypothetical protein n=1 Tax=Rothia koreensis TaxID=592378 RepID=UPI0037C95A5F
MLITETTSSTPKTTGTGRLLVRIIDPGQGSSGYYPADTLTEAAQNRVIPAGTHMYVNHPSDQETYDRPEGDLRNLAGVLTEDARVGDNGALVAEAKLYPHWSCLKDMSGDIGVSIRGNAEIDESSGVRTVTKITEVQSVDFVTRPGRGGRVLKVLENARPTTTEAVEAMTGDIAEWLEKAVGEKKSVIDFDTDTVVWRDWGSDGGEICAQKYTIEGVTVTLVGDPWEVNREQVFHAVTQDQPTTTDTPTPEKTVPEQDRQRTGNKNRTSNQEATMPHNSPDATQIKDLTTRAEKAETELAEARRELRRARAETIVTEAFAGVTAPKGKARLVESAINRDVFDPETFRTEAMEAAAEYQPGTGVVRGLGTQENTDPVNGADQILALRGLKK